MDQGRRPKVTGSAANRASVADEGSITCSACGEKFDGFSALVEHVRSVRGVDAKHPLIPGAFLGGVRGTK